MPCGVLFVSNTSLTSRTQLKPEIAWSGTPFGTYVCVKTLVWYLPGDLVGPDRVFNGPLAEAQEGSNECEGDRDQEPEGQELHQGEEGHRGRRPLVPKHQVHHEEVGEYDPVNIEIKNFR